MGLLQGTSGHRRAGGIGAAVLFWQTARGRSILIQAVAVAGVLAVLWLAVSNAASNLDAQGKNSGFGFLNDVAGFDIAFSVIPFDRESDTHARVFLVGMVNTLLVATVGIILSTVLGLIVGLMRLSGNWLIARLATIYIEIIRNVPLLIQILFWYALLLGLPRVRESIDIGGLIFINNRGLVAPRPVFEEGMGWVLFACLLGILMAFGLARRSARLRKIRGRGVPVAAMNTAIILGLPTAAWFLMGNPVSWDMPEPGPFEFSGGFTIYPSFVAMLLALTAYTAAFIGEIVRSGIQSVGQGQREAARALGLRPGQMLRHVILPQALRVIVPPTTSQYLNLTKNSSLGIVVGYPDIVATFGSTTLTQTGQEIETLFLVMMFYLAISLLIALIMNVYNRAVALKGS